jgi:D-alanine-D-alanine ligase
MTILLDKLVAAANGRFPWRVALLVNLKDDVMWDEDAPPDAGAEFDGHETAVSIMRALESDGHTVRLCAADHTLPDALLDMRPDICFNIAEGIGGDAREAQTPALCELLGVPYTASRVLANALSLDKTMTKRIWHSHGLPTAPFQEFQTGDERLDATLSFPLFVKPAREGTGMGISPHSVVHDEAQLRQQVAWILATYRQPALVEPFLPGREFTVGFIGNPVGQTAELNQRQRPYLYDGYGYHFFPVLEIDSGRSLTPGIYGVAAKSMPLADEGAPGYLCPADISPDLRRELITVTRQAAQALGVCDVSRIDFRLDANGRPMLLEINTLPGLNPAVSDLCIMAAAEGVAYEHLITEILYLAAARHGLHPVNVPLPHLDQQPAMEAAVY